MKKIFALLLVAVMCLSLAACGNAATNDESSTEQQQENNETEQQEESTEQESNETNSSEENAENADPFADFDYREENGGIIITGYHGTDTSVVIPEGVVKIEAVPFMDYTALKEVSIPNSVTEMGTQLSPFMGCVNLESVNIGGGLTEIYGWFSGMQNLKTVTISDGVTKIWGNAFYGCSSLETVIIPESVTMIGSAAFWSCTNLKTLKIPESVTKIVGINDSAMPTFGGCDNLTLSVKAGSYAEQYAIDNNIPYTTYE